MGGRTQNVKVLDASGIFEMNDATNCRPEIRTNIPKAVAFIGTQLEEVVKKEKKEIKELKEERDRQTAVFDAKRIDKEIGKRETLIVEMKKMLKETKQTLQRIQ